ncbi:MAG: Dam family site-specific DNA-(adenine-N6)-methyltransferase [Spirochaetaceae bacterium]|nr:Dam family site-specific DNA-(adenine-N6)-methyltransferase [Spirochaetaceae bacterium]
MSAALLFEQPTIARPVLKWAGGKGRLLKQFEEYYPYQLENGMINCYVEPFLGGGALYFALSVKYKIKQAYLYDLNQDLILTYNVVQKRANDLLKILEAYQKRYDETPTEERNTLFLSIRKDFNESKPEIDYKNISKDWVLRAAQFIFLNKTCFNGLFRVNQKGKFNVPFGKYKTVKIYDPTNIKAVSKCLKNAEIIHAEYFNCYPHINEQTFVYFDPPYRPLSSTSSFTTYTGFEFTDKNQLELANFFKKLDKEQGAKLMLSNSDSTNINPNDSFFEEAYKGYNFFKVSASRAINCKADGRGKINELLITNYERSERLTTNHGKRYLINIA